MLKSFFEDPTKKKEKVKQNEKIWSDFKKQKQMIVKCNDLMKNSEQAELIIFVFFKLYWCRMLKRFNFLLKKN